MDGSCSDVDAREKMVVAIALKQPKNPTSGSRLDTREEVVVADASK